MAVFYTFGQAYGEGVFSSDAYNGDTTTTTTPPVSTAPPAATTGTTTTATGTATPAPATNNGVLANTGVELIAGATLASVIIFSALVVKFWKRPAKKA